MAGASDVTPVAGAGVELLAPAGSAEAFDAALAAGADAIYVGLGNSFNARRSAKNLTDDEFSAAAAKAHLAGSRVYVTMNVVIKDAEMPHALRCARRAWALGADALIVQDWGLLFELRHRWPEIECHASTQMSIMDARGCAFAHAQGVSRVTLARELTLCEVAGCAATGVEVEVFGHGALCICYSGLCLMSSLGGSRSANRGLCAQPCRLPYVLADGNGGRVAAVGRDRPLCPRDLRGIDDLGELAALGVSSVKVEGRMKAPEYVHAVTSAYRDALDGLGVAVRPDGPTRPTLGAKARDELLRRAFNRDFTDAYLHGTSGDELMSYERSNNRGELVGTVVGSRSLGRRRVRHGGGNGGRERLRSVTVAEVSLALERQVGAGDLLELRPVEDPSQFVTAIAPEDVPVGGSLTVRVPKAVPPGSTVRVIRSQAAIEAIRAVNAACPRRRLVDVRITARLGRPLEVSLATADGLALASASGDIVEAARTRAVTDDELAEHAARLGSSPFMARTTSVDRDAGVGVPFSAVHRVRAKAVARLCDALLAPYGRRTGRSVAAPDAHDLSAHLRHLRSHDGRMDPGDAPDVRICALVADAQTAHAVARAGAVRIYAPADLVGELRLPAPGAMVVPWLDEVCRQADHDRLDRWVTRGKPVAVGNVSELALAFERGALAEVCPCIPVHNASALLALEQAGAEGLWLSGELSLPEIDLLASAARVPIGLIVHGRARAMTSEHCVLQATGACAHDCARCAIRLRAHHLIGTKGERYPVTTDAHGRSRVWASRPLDLVAHVGELIRSGVTRLMVDASLLSCEEAAEAVARVAAAVSGDGKVDAKGAQSAGATTGHLFAEIL